MPIHRLGEEPRIRGVLGDVTCDSDGKIDQFIDLRDIKRTLPLHEMDDAPYYLGAFLVGAYQEILGDLHNLFGDTNTVHVDFSENGEVVLETIVKGQTVNEVLQYAQYDGRDLIHRLQVAVETAVHRGLLGEVEAGRFVKFYEEALNGYTYLENSGE
jgi:arginine decarboxylase